MQLHNQILGNIIHLPNLSLVILARSDFNPLACIMVILTYPFFWIMANLFSKIAIEMNVLAVRKMINLCKSVNKLEVGFSNIFITLECWVNSREFSFKH